MGLLNGMFWHHVSFCSSTTALRSARRHMARRPHIQRLWPWLNTNLGANPVGYKTCHSVFTEELCLHLSPPILPHQGKVYKQSSGACPNEAINFQDDLGSLARMSYCGIFPLAGCPWEAAQGIFSTEDAADA